MNIFLLDSVNRLDSEGNVFSESLYTYDENNNLIGIRTPSGEIGGGTTEYIYDENNNLISETYFYVVSINGFTTGSTTNYTYDENDNLIAENFNSSLGAFSNDGIDRLTTYTYDENNNLTTEIGEFYSPEEVLEIISTTSYVYDESNNLLTETEDENSDGTIDSIITYTYGENNNLISQSEDNNNDGTIDSITTYIYDGSNNLVTETLDENGDGNSDLVTIYSYDANNNLIIETTDGNGDGEIDTTFEYNYIQLDELGNEVVNNNTEDITGVDVYRFFRTDTQTQFYTTTDVERESVLTNLPQYELEGISFVGVAVPEEGELVTGISPVYRFFNTNTGIHLYTADENERAFVEENLDNYVEEGTPYFGYNTQVEGTIPLYRFYNAALDAHFYTPSVEERDLFIDSPDYEPEGGGEGIAFYVEPAPE